MGDQRIDYLNSEGKKEFLKSLLDDISALEYMIDNKMIESGIQRIGAEQEFCLVKKDFRPSPDAPEILEAINEKHYTPELARWNLEINLDPLELKNGCFSGMHRQLDELLERGYKVSKEFDNNIVLTGILPTIRQSELDFSYMTPNPRYRVLDNIMKEFKGEEFQLYLEGVDELNIKHDSILFEACNTSFQIHLQIEPDEFADQYNWAQVLAGPVLSSCVNSPILMGKELWSETRIALFRQSIDIRNSGNYIREKQPRVAFGYGWLKDSAAEIFKQDIAQYNLIISAEIEENSMETLRNGGIPKLHAMNLHNGTIYKWNRACYGVGGGVPHLRIENRYVPSGPSTIDEMANTALWVGLMKGMPKNFAGDWENLIYFQDVRDNFLKAARHGLSNEFAWFGQKERADKLLLDSLIPLAESGLKSVGIESQEIEKYLGVVQKRVESRQTGADWIIKSLRQLRQKHNSAESILMITQATHENNKSGKPGHEWKIVDDSNLHLIPNRFDRVDSIMATDLLTVTEDDLVVFAEKLMSWHDYENLPVENIKGHVVGVISKKDIERFHREGKVNPEKLEHGIIKNYMHKDVITISPETSYKKAKAAMNMNDFDCLPVVKNGFLVGIITDDDIRKLK